MCWTKYFNNNNYFEKEIFEIEIYEVVLTRLTLFLREWYFIQFEMNWIENDFEMNWIENELKWIQIELKFELNRNEFWNEFIKKNSISSWIEMEVEIAFETNLKLFI